MSWGFLFVARTSLWTTRTLRCIFQQISLNYDYREKQTYLFHNYCKIYLVRWCLIHNWSKTWWLCFSTIDIADNKPGKISEKSVVFIVNRYTTYLYLDNRWPLTADHHSWFAFAVSFCFCSCLEEFWIAIIVFAFAVSVCSLPGVIWICCFELFFAVINCTLPWWIVFCRDK